MAVEDILEKSRAWVASRRARGPVISSRIRLARNLDGFKFPEWAEVAERRKIFERLTNVLAGLDSLRDALVLPLDGMNPVDREVLHERRLISREMVVKGSGSGLVVSAKERIALMVNEEDHLRMQILRPGLNLFKAWERLDLLDSELEKQVRYAFSAELGYLTSCPSNVGTGLRVSVMLSLPGLKLMQEVDKVAKGLNRMGLAVRGMFGEGSEDYSSIYQVSNQTTLGMTELETVRKINDIAETLTELEENARLRLRQQREVQVCDYIARALAIAQNCRILSSGEALDILSALRLGLEFDMVKGISLNRVGELMLQVQPGHLQKDAGQELAMEVRDIRRANLIRGHLKRVAFCMP